MTHGIITCNNENRSRMGIAKNVPKNVPLRDQFPPELPSFKSNYQSRTFWRKKQKQDVSCPFKHDMSMLKNWYSHMPYEICDGHGLLNLQVKVESSFVILAFISLIQFYSDCSGSMLSTQQIRWALVPISAALIELNSTIFGSVV